MKKINALVIFFLMITSATFSQVGINATGSLPAASAMLDVSSTDKGLLIPCMTTAQRNNISSPAEGLMVYDTDLGSLCFYRSGIWNQASILTPGSSSANQVAFWSSPGILSGNNNLYWDNSNSRLGIGTVGPSQQLEITEAFKLPLTTSSITGVIYKGGTRFMHDYDPPSNNGFNTFIGSEAGNFTMTGPDPWDASYNTGVGRLALSEVSSGSYNSAFGSYALRVNSAGAYNTAVGAEALYTNSTGNGNTATGEGALYSNTTGGYNAGFGINALSSNTTGNDNTAMGSSALLYNSIGSDNTAVGHNALVANTTANRNTALGKNALYTQSYDNGGATWNSHNVAIGYSTLSLNQPTSTSTGIGNTAVGNLSLNANVTGNYNTAVGYDSDVSSGTLSNTVSLGYNAIADASNQVRLGNSNISTFYCKGAWAATSTSKPNMVVDATGQIMQSTATIPSGTGATNQVAFWSGSGVLSGENDLYWDNTNNRLGIGIASPNQQIELTGAFRFPATSSATIGVIYKGADRFIHDYKPGSAVGGNTFVGINAGNFTMSGTSTDASYNTASGYQSLTSLTTGNDNTATGYQALTAVTSGGRNTANGALSLSSNTIGIHNVAIGHSALLKTVTGSYNTAVGVAAGNGVTGNSFSANSLFGYQAGNALTTGSQNILIGYGAGLLITTGSNNIVIGYNVTVPSITADHQMVIGGQDLLYGDLLNNRIGLGTTTPGQKLEVKDGNLLMSNSGFAGEIRFAEPSAGGVNYTAFKAQSQAGDVTYTLPAADGASGNVLSTNGAGTLSWWAPGDITRVGSMTSGDAFFDGTADDDWLGLGGAAGRIEFDDLTTDEVNILNANVGIGTNTPIQKLEVRDGNLLMSNTGAAGEVRFAEASGSGTNYTSFKAQAQTANVAYTLPAADGASGNVLSTNGAGTLSWWAPGDITRIGSMTSGDAFFDGTADDDWLGLGAAAGRIEFDNQAINEINILNANVGIGTSTPGQQLELTGNLKLPATTASTGIIYAGTSPFLHNFGTRNIFLGALSGNLITLSGGVNNTGIGDSTLYSLTEGDYNVAIGTSVLKAVTTASGNTVVGTRAGMKILNNGYNTILGYQAGTQNTADRNTMIGCESGMVNTTGQYNVFLGHQSGFSNTTGRNSTGLGFRALYSQTGYPTADDLNNTAVGFEALYSTNPTTYLNGRENVAVGHQSGYSNTTGVNNTAVGTQALFTNSTGTDNTALGYYALKNSTGDYNTGIGDGALGSSQTGDYNTAVGGFALYTNTIGSFNTALGSYADCSASNLTNATAIGYDASASSSNQVRLGNTAITSLYCYGAYAGTVGGTNVDLFADISGKIGYVASSARYKDNIISMENVDWLYDLRPVNFTYKSDEIKKQQYGLIAEEVEKVNPDFVSYNKDGSVETVSYSQLISPMLKAIQEQQALIEELQKRIETLEKEQQGLSQK